eukprot:6105687-Pleurochrysis_carterae.AAC.1
MRCAPRTTAVVIRTTFTISDTMGQPATGGSGVAVADWGADFAPPDPVLAGTLTMSSRTRG